MPVSRQDYVSTIHDCYPGQKITMETLIETLISKYGNDNYMTDIMLDNILNILLGEGKDMAFAINNDPCFSSIATIPTRILETERCFEGADKKARVFVTYKLKSKKLKPN